MQAFRHLLFIAGLTSFLATANKNKETPTKPKITIRVFFTPTTSGDLVAIIDKALEKRFAYSSATVNPNVEQYPSVDIGID